VASIEPMTVMQMFDESAKKFASHTALRVKRGGKWVEWTYKDYHRDVKLFARALMHVSLKPHECISIIGECAAAHARITRCHRVLCRSAVVCAFI
jgi:long-subunit acyl-CoA synthetase (AMP-forming)